MMKVVRNPRMQIENSTDRCIALTVTTMFYAMLKFAHKERLVPVRYGQSIKLCVFYPTNAIFQ